MVSPVPDERDTKRIKRFSHYGLAHQPVDLREGVAKAYTVVKEVKKKKKEKAFLKDIKGTVYPKVRHMYFLFCLKRFLSI